MKGYKCDRPHGTWYTDNEGGIRLAMSVFMPRDTDQQRSADAKERATYDLCPACRKEFFAFMGIPDPKPEKKPGA